MPTSQQRPQKNEGLDTHACTLPRRLRVLHTSVFFQQLPDADIADICALFGQRAYHAAETIYTSGEPATHLYIVATGKIKLMRSTPAGKSVVMEIISPGQFFGMLSTLGREQYIDTAVAHTNACVLSITAPDFDRILRRYPAVSLAALDIVSARLRQMHDIVEELTGHSVERRIASTLLKLAEKFGERQDDSILIGMPLSQQDIAEMTGTVRETASRALSQFKAAGLIATGHRWIAVKDVARLGRVAAGTAELQA